MKNSFREFELKVQGYCSPEDFKKNQEKLKSIALSSYDTFLSILMLGGSIITSIKACEEILKLSLQTSLTESELVELSNKFRIDTILKAIEKDPVLMQFTQARITGKTYALKKLDEILDAKVKDNTLSIDNPFLMNKAKEIQISEIEAKDIVNSLKK